MNRLAASLGCLLAISARCLAQDNAGDTYDDRTPLAPGQLSVTELLQTEFAGPDLILRALDSEGNEIGFDDDSSIYGDGFAPGLFDVPVGVGGAIEFQISGFGDENFTGDHLEFGEIDIYVDIFGDDFAFVDGFVENAFVDGFVPEDAVYTFFDANPAWEDAFYTVDVNNAFPNDVDFFTFSGLTPGESFTAETRSVPDANLIDTVLGLFDEFGNLIDSADEGGEFNYSLLTGVVPDSGEITLAVSGFGDEEFFEGFHPFLGEYELVVTEGGGPVVGDYDGDGDVDADDYTTWRNAFGQGGPSLPADGNGDGIVNAPDYTIWRDAFAQQPLAVPEPIAAVLALVATAPGWRRRQA